MTMDTKLRRQLDRRADRETREADEAQRICYELGVTYPVCGFDLGMGWMPIVEQALKDMIEIGWNKQLDQVKQKFCQLRIYVGHTTNDEVYEIIDRAEVACDRICYDCGKERENKGASLGRPSCNACKVEALK